MEFDIENFANEKAKEITKLIISEYEDFELEEGEATAEIYERSDHEANGFFLSEKFEDFTKESIEALKSHARGRLKNSREADKMSNKELLALMIETYIQNYLFEWKDIYIVL